jgi:hypothetical protein
VILFSMPVSPENNFRSNCLIKSETLILIVLLLKPELNQPLLYIFF